jgi:hypothetical protein
LIVRNYFHFNIIFRGDNPDTCLELASEYYPKCPEERMMNPNEFGHWICASQIKDFNNQNFKEDEDQGIRKDLFP